MKAIPFGDPTRAAGLFLWLVLLAACGGKSSNTPADPGHGIDAGVDDPPDAASKPVDAGIDAAREPNDAGADAAGLSCPGDGEVVPPDCSSASITLPFVQGAIQNLANGVSIEALQIPMFTEANRGEGFATVPPEQWDRSELPAGACVFRLRGLHMSCYAPNHYGNILVGGCDALVQPGPAIVPASYYDQRNCHETAPGCASAKWNIDDGYWWYLNSRAEDVADLVICAPQCAGSFTPSGACLMFSLR